MFESVDGFSQMYGWLMPPQQRVRCNSWRGQIRGHLHLPRPARPMRDRSIRRVQVLKIASLPCSSHYKAPWKGCKRILSTPQGGGTLSVATLPGADRFRSRTDRLTPLFGLAPDGVYRAACHAWRGGLLPHLFTLSANRGGLFSGTVRRRSFETAACMYPRQSRGYAASCPVVFGLSSPAFYDESDPPPFRWD